MIEDAWLGPVACSGFLQWGCWAQPGCSVVPQGILGSTCCWPFLFDFKVSLDFCRIYFICGLQFDSCVHSLVTGKPRCDIPVWVSWVTWRERFLRTPLVTFPQSYFSGSLEYSQHVMSGSKANGKLTSIYSIDIRFCLVQTRAINLRAPV